MLFPFMLLCLCTTGCRHGVASPPEPAASADQLTQPPKPSAPTSRRHKIRYTVHFLAPGAENIIPELRENSQLTWLETDPPDSRVGLERRMLEDVATAQKILRSHGYYDGTAQGQVDWERTPVRVELELDAGRQYTIGTTAIRYRRPDGTFSPPAPSTAEGSEGSEGSEARRQTKPDARAVQGRDFLRTAPSTLTSFGLKPGDPAVASAVLDAVNNVLTALHEQGYPLAVAGTTRYIVDRSTGKLEAALSVDTGPLLRMGDVAVREEQGEPAVSAAYLNRLATWTPGQFWDDRLLKTYRTALQETGLFSSIALEPGIKTLVVSEAKSHEPDTPKPHVSETSQAQTSQAPQVQASQTPQTAQTSQAPQTAQAQQASLTPIDLLVRDAPPRTISGGVQYSTDTGAGVRGTWENRNLFGSGEHLRLTAPLAPDLQLLTATFRKPAFGIREQTLVGEAEARNETSDAYDQTAGYVAGGLERRFSGDWRNWWASARLSLEAGTLNDNLQKSRRAYSLFGVPLAVRRDTTDDLFNPTTGTRASLTVTPYIGTYNGALGTVRTRLDASGYSTPFATSRVVLAARFGTGSLSGGTVGSLPASLRFYAGGGGSVRGYKYQSLGPHDRNGDPVGGLSFTDVGVEARFKITEHFGLVPFLDGGMVYENTLPKWGKDMAWGAGLGFRYYTVIGPIRLDVATPLQDRDNNKAFQLYLSIGQAF